MYESVTTFTKKIFRHTAGSKVSFIRSFIIGDYDSRFSITHIKRMCDITGMTFEELFERRKQE